MGAKPYEISKHQVMKAWNLVKAKRGSGGIDGQSLQGFEENLKDNLYLIWNRMSSGSYFPPGVKGVEIPKTQGGTRLLGIPTISDRVAQTVVKLQIEKELESIFHNNSYGYRPNRQALDAVKVTRDRCWRWNWVLEFDIRAMFDRIPHELLMKAVETHVKDKWCRLYIERWLKVEFIHPNGQREARTDGTPQGGVISPLLSNLFMHYAFDMWMERTFPGLPWCRYADDGVIHCRTRADAESVKEALGIRFKSCGLELHGDKTHVVYTGKQAALRQTNRTKLDFLGYTFCPRTAQNRSNGNRFVSFLPAVSEGALGKMKKEIKWGWKLRLWSDYTLDQIAERINPIVRGWFNYYAAFYPSRMRKIARFIDQELVAWFRRKFKLPSGGRHKLYEWLRKHFKIRPKLFAHWKHCKVY